MNPADRAAINHAHLCECGAHGYTQGTGRWGDAGLGSCYVDVDGYRSVFYRGDRDCSSSVIDAWQEALRGTDYEGALSGATYTGDMRAVFVNSGLFEWKPMSFIAQRGDIYLCEKQHTALCQSAIPDMLSEFLHNENGGIYDGVPGDQTGTESVIRAYWDFPWDGILHYVGPTDLPDKDEQEPEETPETEYAVEPIRYRVSLDPSGKDWLSTVTDYSNAEGDGYAGCFGSPIRWLAININGWYQAFTVDNGWLPKVSAYDVNDLENGCAGDGSPVLGIRVYDYKAGIYACYAAHALGGDWFADMHDLSDTGGSNDDFAGNLGKYIDGFRICEI